ncbi:MAG: Eco57I restriction-modification methylase domain-containing protein, partial [Alphaproteobacteria bacterium]
MDEKLAGILIEKTFENPYNEERFWYLMKSIFYETKKKDDVYNAQNDKIESCRILFEYKTKEALDENIDILVVKMKTLNSLEKARSSQRNFVATYLQQRRKQAVLVAFYTDEDDGKEWRFSFVKKDSSYDFEKNKKNDKFTPAKRYSYLVGENENSHTAKTYLHKLLKDNDDIPTLQELEDAFAIEKVSKDFFTKYKNLYLRLFDVIEDLRNKNSSTGFDFLKIDSDLFCKKTLGQIVFLYFLQKKGWLGVPLDKDWSQGDKSFMRTLFEKAKEEGKNYFNDYLEPLFYKALAERNPKDWYEELKCKIPFLNGGLFEPINSYDWEKKFVVIPNKLFSNENKDGILDILDIYNFTVKEDEPLEKEVAIDPEMLGQIFENLLDIKDRKKDGAFYTPREIVHYMCQESLINYLYTKINYKQISINGELPIGDTLLLNQSVKIERKDIEDFICHGDISSFIKQFAKEINEALRTVKVCDPAIGSGAFPVGMMHEVISARRKLVDEKCLPEAQKRSSYAYKKDFIKNSLYGVDIEKSAVEIAKLRLWLSLIVDEDDKKNIEPLPNLDYKLVQGNSLLSIDKKSKGANQALLEDIERDKDIVFNESLKRNKLRLKNKINKNLETFYEIYNKFHDENPVSFDFEIHFSE